MNEAVRRDRESLRELSGLRPEQVRKQVLDVLQRATGAESALWYAVAPRDGAFAIVDHRVAGDGIIHRCIELQKRDRITGRDFRRPQRSWALRFNDLASSLRDVPAPAVARYREQIVEPHGIHDFLSLVPFDGDVCLGWVGAIRLGGRRFSTGHHRHLSAVLPEVRAALVAAHRLERVQAPSESADVLLTPSGRVELVSVAAGVWVSLPEVRAALAAGARALDQGGQPPRWIAGADVSWTRLSGDGTTRYLVHASPPPPLVARGALALTGRQRAVADLAAEGFAVSQIAARLGLADETVRTHLRAVYTRLQVASRVELRRALRDA